MSSLETKLAWIGLAEKAIAETTRNAKLASALSDSVDEAGITGPFEKGSMVYAVATRLPADAVHHRKTILSYVVGNKFASTAQLEAAVAYAVKNKSSPTLNLKEMEEASGVGVVVSEAEIAEASDAVIAAAKAELTETRYRFPFGKLMKGLTEKVKWADLTVARGILEKKVADFLGPKTAEDEKPLPSKKEAKPAAAASATGTAPSKKETESNDVLQSKWPLPSENPYNTPELLAAHLKRTGGQVRTRFPPEPNGYLHVGHAKAMYIDFGQATTHDGICYLRYDDTNPDAEKQEYIDAIAGDVAWMGYTPVTVTYASDNFQKLYELAVELIKRGHAYVCHQTPEEIKIGREQSIDSPWRNRTVEENLHEFERMRLGLYAEGGAVLRMKMDMKHPKTCMRDLIAYRVLMTPHHRTGTTWCIYPSYDYTHCICDSLEDITHSLCTREFNIRRESYYWVLEKLDMYRPIVWEYSRLNLSHTVVSKRTLKAIVAEGLAREWDDPRMPTLMALRRRGFAPAAIRAFCAELGISASDNTLIPYDRLENAVRDDLDVNARRTFVVLEPLKVTITNYPEDSAEEVEAPDFPANKAKGSHKMPFSRVVYIERNDFRLVDDKDYKGLAPGKEVALKYAFNIKCTKVIEKDGKVVELEAEFDRSNSNKVKGHIHWVAAPAAGKAPLTIEVRLYEHLFTAEDMNVHKKTWREVVNPKSETIITNALIEPSIVGLPAGTCFQGERVGFFCVDRTTTADHIVLTRVVGLKESYPKFAAAAAAPTPKSKGK